MAIKIKKKMLKLCLIIFYVFHAVLNNFCSACFSGKIIKMDFIILYKYFMLPKTDDFGEKAVGFFADFLHLKILKKYSHTSNLHT